jgi:hypothetical protein
MKRVGFALSATLLVAVSGVVRGQDRPPIRQEVRIDATTATEKRLELSGGAAIPVGTYVRVAILAGGGLARDARGSPRTERQGAAARADLIARFEIDPFHQSVRGLYSGGGVSYLASEGARGRVYLALVAGIELRDHGRVAPAMEVALGGGVRIGFVLRRATPRWR